MLIQLWKEKRRCKKRLHKLFSISYLKKSCRFRQDFLLPAVVFIASLLCHSFVQIIHLASLCSASSLPKIKKWLLLTHIKSGGVGIILVIDGSIEKEKHEKSNSFIGGRICSSL